MARFTAPGWLLISLPVLFSLCLHAPPCSGQYGENLTQLLQDIVRVDGRVRPVRSASTVTVVSVSFHLMSIINFDTVEQKLISNGWLFVTWNNEYTRWNPSDYGWAYSVSPDPNTVWRPRLTVINTMKDLKPLGEDYILILAVYDGTTMWLPAERFETFCKVDVTYFPFDIQTCRWTLFSWGADNVNSTDLQPVTPTIDLDTFVVNGEWELRNTRAWREEVLGSAYLHYEVTLRRRPSLLALTVLLPVLVLAVVNVYVFTIPSEAGERLAYSMTSLLSFGVFMSFILDSMPSSTETLSIVAVNLSALLVMSAIYVMLCILSLRLFHRDSDKHPVPQLVQNLIVWLEILVCLDPPSRNNKVTVVYHTPMTLTDMTGTEALMMGGTRARGDGAGMGRPRQGLKGRLEDRLDQWAVKRKQNHAAYTDPKEMTWRRVSRTLDKLLFRFFLLLIVASNVVIWTIMVVNYYS